MSFLRTSLNAFYNEANLAESVRIAGIIRTLVHETPKAKPLLRMANTSGLDLQILDNVAEPRAGCEEIIRFAVGLRLGPEATPAVDLSSAHYVSSSIGAWWSRTVFLFTSRLGTVVTYTRKEVLLILANKEGSAHVDQHEDPNYARLRGDLPLRFEFCGIQLETPDLARFLAAQAGVEMLECLKRNFFSQVDVPLRWEVGTPPAVATYFDELSVRALRVSSIFSNAEIRVTKRL